MEPMIDVEYSERPNASRVLFAFEDLGMVGKRAADLLIKSKNARKVGEVYLDTVTEPVMMQDTMGNMRMIKHPGAVVENGKVGFKIHDIYYDEVDDLLIVTGAYQGTSAKEAAVIAEGLFERVASSFERFDAPDIYSFASVGTTARSPQPKTYVVASTKEALEEMKDLGMEPLGAGNVADFGGLPAVITAAAKRSGRKAVLIAPETLGAMPQENGPLADPIATQVALKAFERATGISVGLKALDAEIPAYEAAYGKAVAEQAEQMKLIQEQLARMMKLPQSGDDGSPGVA